MASWKQGLSVGKHMMMSGVPVSAKSFIRHAINSIWHERFSIFKWISSNLWLQHWDFVAFSQGLCWGLKNIQITKTLLWFLAEAVLRQSNKHNVKTLLQTSSFPTEVVQPRNPKQQSVHNNIKSLYCLSGPFPTEIMTYPELSGIFVGVKIPHGRRRTEGHFSLSVCICFVTVHWKRLHHGHCGVQALWFIPLAGIGWPASARQRHSIPTV